MEIQKRIRQQKTLLAYYKRETEEPEPKFPELPLDIEVNIISRLPIKLIMRCKCLSKAFNKLISDHPFMQLYLTNNRSKFLYTLIVNDKECKYEYEFDRWLDLMEFDLNEAINNKCEDNRFVTRNSVFDLNILPEHTVHASDFNSMWNHCNGLVITSVTGPLYVINPIMRQFIQLPEPPSGGHMRLTYGIGFCQLTNRYKVLRIKTNYFRGMTSYEYYSEILTIDSDQNWRRLENYVPYNIKGYHGQPNPPMHAFRSALHWIVESGERLFEPNWSTGGTCICALDMTEEKVSALPMPPLVDDASCVRLTVLLDKLSVWEVHGHAKNDVNIWAMDGYGVKCSWTKQFAFKLSTLAVADESNYFEASCLELLTLLPGGVLVVSNGVHVLFYDINKDECLRVFDDIEELHCLLPFVPSFVPLKDPFQE